MATELIKFRGKAMWARVHVPDDAFNDLAWRIKLYLTDPDEVTRFNSLGVRNKVNRDAEGDFVNLKRNTTKLSRGRTITFTPPVVTDKNDNPMAETIENGTDVEVTLEYYTYKAPGGTGTEGKAIRLHKVQQLV